MATVEEARKKIADGIHEIDRVIDAVRIEGTPLRKEQLDLKTELVQEAKRVLQGYMDFLEIDDPWIFWSEARIDGEPGYDTGWGAPDSAP